jgi:hypothetical protein
MMYAATSGEYYYLSIWYVRREEIGLSRSRERVHSLEGSRSLGAL